MSKEWTILLISGATDFIILTGTSLTAAMMAKGDAQLPTWPVILLSVIGGIVAFARTIQQSLKAQTRSESVTTTRVEVKQEGDKE